MMNGLRLYKQDSRGHHLVVALVEHAGGTRPDSLKFAVRQSTGNDFPCVRPLLLVLPTRAINPLQVRNTQPPVLCKRLGFGNMEHSVKAPFQATAVPQVTFCFVSASWIPSGPMIGNVHDSNDSKQFDGEEGYSGEVFP